MSVSEQNDSQSSGPAHHHVTTAGAGGSCGAAESACENRGPLARQAWWRPGVQARRPFEETTVPGDVDAPWDAFSAEALMHVWEVADAESEALPPPREHPQPEPQAAAHATPGAGSDQTEAAMLEQRIAAFAAALGQWLDQIDPEKSLAAFHQRLAEFERRLALALAKLASCGDASALVQIEAQVGELSTQLAATRKELGRLEAIDGQLNALAQLLEAQRGQRETPAGSMERDALDSLAQTAADRAVRQYALEAPHADARTAQGQQIVAPLEAMLQRFMAERRADADGSVRVLRRIDDALARIAARMASVAVAPEERLDESDGLAAESDRLTEAYAAGARALGQQPFALDATDYVARSARER
jgi:hypothetical protein